MRISNYKTTDEETLLKEIKGGNMAAFEDLYSRHFNTMYGMAYNLLREHQQSKDIVQDIFVWFWEHRTDWNLVSAKGYLLTAVKFKIANYFRQNKVRNECYEKLRNQKIIFEKDDLHLEVKQLMELIKTFTRDLPERCREVFGLSRFEHLSNREIAAKLNISEKTVEAHITLALKKLKEKIGKGYFYMFFL